MLSERYKKKKKKGEKNNVGCRKKKKEKKYEKNQRKIGEKKGMKIKFRNLEREKIEHLTPDT